MNPVRYLNGGWSPVLIGVLALALVILTVAWWARARERRGDWGPGLLNADCGVGYSPSDLRETSAATAVDDPNERWLLGLAAPFVEQAGLLHDRWSLVPAFCDHAWRRRLASVATIWNATRARSWRAQITALEQQIGMIPRSPDSVDTRPWLIAKLAMLLRLGVAARHTGASRARRRLAQAAAATRADYTDWLGYGDAIIEGAELFGTGRITDLRADLRMLYAPGGPWHDTAWEWRADG